MGFDSRKYELQGKTALVCGASQGIGEATAQLLAARGARVILLSRSSDKLEVVLKKLSPGNHQKIVADLTDTEDLRQNILPLLALEEIHILVNNAAGPRGGPLHLASVDEFQDPFRAHLLAAHLLTQTLLSRMKKAQYGRVINIVSTSVKNPLENLGVSNTIRGAVANWAKTLAMELGPFGITVNNVLPGYTKTERMDALLEAFAQQRGVDRKEIEEQWRLTIPLRRLAESAEIAEGVAFLASPAASYINGINLPVDGGRTPSL